MNRANYPEFVTERFVPQSSSRSKRSEFARDRARVLHSSALRRLSAKTQVLSPESGDFARTRLTHSLEVAQVGRELAIMLGLDADLVDMACLSHDLGHPPFGHNGESALNLWAAEIGGFEGNAQTFRLVTRLEQKVIIDGVSRGLNLTRASLDALSKYPWRLSEASRFISGGVKFGVYEDDLEVFNWAREQAPAGEKVIEAEIMDFSDDVAYSIHDFEDAIVEGFIDVREINGNEIVEQVITGVLDWSETKLERARVYAAFERIRANEFWITSFDGTRENLAQLKNLTSDLIGSFVTRVFDANQSLSEETDRYKKNLVVPEHVKEEIAVLKGLVATFLMTSDARQGYYQEQRALLVELADAIYRTGVGFDQVTQYYFDNAKNADQKKRAVVDAVANMTDAHAHALHEDLVG